MAIQNLAPRDDNHVTVLMGTDISTVSTTRIPVIVGVDSSTNRLLVSAVITGGGTSGTQYNELDTTSPGNGTLALGRYKSAAPTLTDGQFYGLQLDSSGNLKVTGSLSVGGTTDNSAYTAGSSTGTPSYGFYHSTIDTVTDGRTAAIGMTSKRGMFVNLQTAAGVETGVAAAPLQVSLANTASNATAVKVDGSAVTQPVSLATNTPTLQSGSTTAVTQATAANLNATVVGTGTLAVQNTAATPAGTNLMGKVGLDQTTPGTTNAVSLAQIGATTVLSGNGTAGAGAQRVTIASDNTAFSVNATLSAETTKVIGTVNQGTSPWVISGSLTNISGTISLPTGAATEASLAKLPLAQGSTTSGQSGPLVQGAVTTTAPTYTTAQTSPLSLDTSGNLRVAGTFSANPPSSVISSVNSTATNLSGGAVFTGTSEDVSNYAAIQVSVFSSHASATDGLSLQQSSDGTNWDLLDVYSIPATTGKVFSIQPSAKFYRLVYTNGATLTTSLRIQSVYHYSAPNPSSQRPADAYTNETDMTQNWAFASLYNGTTWDRMRGDITNGLDVDVTRLPALVAGSALIGKVSIDQTTPGTTNLVVANQGTAGSLTAGWPVVNGESADTTGTITTPTGSVVASGLIGYANTTVSINGTYGGLVGIWEGSDDGGTNYYPITAAREGVPPVMETTVTPGTNASQSWQINNPGLDAIRFRATALTSGTVNVRISASASPTASGTVVGIGYALPTGTNTIGSLTANQSVNVAQINGVTPLMGNGTTGTGSQRVTIASDNTAFTVNAAQATAANLNATVVGTGTFSVQTSAQVPGTGATNLGKAEDAAAASGDTGVATFGVRNDALTAAQTNATGDYGSFSIDTSGIQIVAGAPRLLKASQFTTITSSTAETTIVTAIASTFADLYGIIIENTSATATEVSLRDVTAGSVRMAFQVPAGDTRGFMLPLDSAVSQTTVNTAWTAQCGTSVASVKISALYVKRV